MEVELDVKNDRWATMIQAFRNGLLVYLLFLHRSLYISCIYVYIYLHIHSEAHWQETVYAEEDIDSGVATWRREKACPQCSLRSIC